MISLDNIFQPTSVVVIGASSDPNRIGGRPLRYYREGPFEGNVYAVNPKRSEIMGYPSFSEVGALPEVPDLAIIALPAPLAMEALKNCIDFGIRGVAVFSAGFAELGEAGAQMQAAMVKMCDESGCTLLGPNCLGVMNAHIGHTATFASFLQEEPAKPGPWAIITQSGAYGTYLYSWLKQLDIYAGLWIATGNEAQVTIANGVRYAAEHAETSGILIFAESLRSGEELIEAVALARRNGKRVGLMKVGVTQAGQKAAESHTLALASDDHISESLMTAAGARWLTTTDEIIDFAYAGTIGRTVPSNRLGIVTISGGAGVLMADSAVKSGLHVPTLSPELQASIKAGNPNASALNPVDVTAQAINEPELVWNGIIGLAASGEVDAIAIYLMNWLETGSTKDQMRTMLEDLQKRADLPPIALAALTTEPTRRWLESLGFLVFSDPNRAVKGLAYLVEEESEQAAAVHAKARPRPTLDKPHYDELQGKAWLQGIGIAVPHEKFCRDASEAASFAAQQEGPCALKIVAKEITHKTDVGGVALDIRDAGRMSDACEAMLTSVRAKAPGADIKGFAVSCMVDEGVDLLVGIHDDACFGQVLTVGIGGVFTEIFGDVAHASCPVSSNEVKQMLLSLKGESLLSGARGAGIVDIDAACDTIAILTIAAAQHRDFDVIEINPLRVMKKGAIALDSVIIPKARRK